MGGVWVPETKASERMASLSTSSAEKIYNRGEKTGSGLGENAEEVIFWWASLSGSSTNALFALKDLSSENLCQAASWSNWINKPAYQITLCRSLNSLRFHHTKRLACWNTLHRLISTSLKGESSLSSSNIHKAQPFGLLSTVIKSKERKAFCLNTKLLHEGMNANGYKQPHLPALSDYKTAMLAANQNTFFRIYECSLLKNIYWPQQSNATIFREQNVLHKDRNTKPKVNRHCVQP